MSSLAATFILHFSLLTSTAASSSLNYRDAYAEAQDSKRPLMIVIGADWCQACKDLKETTIPEMQRQGKLDGVVLTFVDLDENPELAKQLLGGTSIPQVVVFAKGETGWNRKQLTGRQSADSITTLLAPALSIAKTPATSSK
jgi:thioredoxin-like negative regulator of GroEL